MTNLFPTFYPVDKAKAMLDEIYSTPEPFDEGEKVELLHRKWKGEDYAVLAVIVDGEVVLYL